jgi:hypothetical protein
VRLEFEFRQRRRKIEGSVELQRGRNLLEQFGDGADADAAEHLVQLIRGVVQIGHAKTLLNETMTTPGISAASDSARRHAIPVGDSRPEHRWTLRKLVKEQITRVETIH